MKEQAICVRHSDRLDTYLAYEGIKKKQSHFVFNDGRIVTSEGNYFTDCIRPTHLSLALWVSRYLGTHFLLAGRATVPHKIAQTTIAWSCVCVVGAVTGQQLSNILLVGQALGLGYSSKGGLKKKSVMGKIFDHCHLCATKVIRCHSIDKAIDNERRKDVRKRRSNCLTKRSSQLD